MRHIRAPAADIYDATSAEMRSHTHKSPPTEADRLHTHTHTYMPMCVLICGRMANINTTMQGYRYQLECALMLSDEMAKKCRIDRQAHRVADKYT